jgi:tRNA(fMet)-specific endonuclease VapC
MTTAVYLLDTNIVTGILKRDARVVNHVAEALSANARLILSLVVYFEIKRGLLRRDAKNQLAFFEQLAQTLYWDDLHREDWGIAAELWAAEIASGRPPQDADILIAAQVRRLQCILVTNNEDHFAHFGLQIENWLAR